MTTSAKTSMALIVVAALGCAGSARAANDDDTRADVRCVVAMYALMRAPDATANAFSAALFFSGRLEGRDPTFDLAAALKKEGARMGRSEYAHEMQRCGDEVKMRGEVLRTIGQAGAATGGAPRRGTGN